MCERWVGDWTNCNILTFVFSSTSFSFWCAAQSGGPEDPYPSAGCYSILTQTNWLQLTELPVAPGYIIVCRPPDSCGRHICTQFNPSTVKVIPWYLWPDVPVPWLTAGSKVNMLYLDHSETTDLVGWFQSGDQHSSTVSRNKLVKEKLDRALSYSLFSLQWVIKWTVVNK